jgi:hypothetical protein
MYAMGTNLSKIGLRNAMIVDKLTVNKRFFWKTLSLVLVLSVRTSLHET